MATSIMKNRQIDPGVCANEDLAELDPWAQLLFERMPMAADRDGLLEDRPKRIRALIFPYNTELDINKLLDDLAKAGFITRYKANNVKVICIINFIKHQRVHPNEKASILPRPESWPAGKGGKEKNNPDPAHGIKCDFVIDEIKQTLGLDCSHSKAGKILDVAGGSSEYYSFAYSIIAIRRARKWIKSDQFYGAVLKELRERSRWPDKENKNIKIEAGKFDDFLTDHFGGADGSKAE